MHAYHTALLTAIPGWVLHESGALRARLVPVFPLHLQCRLVCSSEPLPVAELL